MDMRTYRAAGQPKIINMPPKETYFSLNTVLEVFLRMTRPMPREILLLRPKATEGPFSLPKILTVDDNNH